LACGRL